MSGRVALLIVVVAILVIFLLGWFVLLSPERAKANKLDDQIAVTDTQLAAVTSLLNGPIGKQSLAGLKISKIAVPDDPNVAQLLRQLSVASAQAGVDLIGITPQPAIASVSGQQIPVSVTVTGRYFALQHFFRILRTRTVLQGDKLHAKGRLYTIDSINFSGTAASSASTAGQTAASNVVSAALAINAYSFAPPAVVPGTAAPTSENTTVTPAPVTSP
jgi:hypothetical protein